MSKEICATDFSEIRWKGHWIWVPEDVVEIRPTLPGTPSAPLAESHGLFRKVVQLSAVPDRVPARITADSRYALYINGREAYRGPVRSQPRRMHYDFFDISPYLRTGDNTIAVYVRFYGRPLAMYMPPVANGGLGKTGALVFEADLAEAGWLVSDDTWKARKDEAWATKEAGMLGGVPVELMDARIQPARWRDAGFDDTGWGNAQKLRAIHIGGFARSQPPVDPYGPLYPRTIAKLGGDVVHPRTVRVEILKGQVDDTMENPGERVLSSFELQPDSDGDAAEFPLELDVPAGSFARLTLDMGRIVSGLVQLDVKAPSGTRFDMAYEEDPVARGSSGPGHQASGSRYLARGHDDLFENFDSNGLRFIYAVVDSATETVTIEKIAVRELIYPWQKGASFECSDPELNRIYTAGVRTVDLNSHDAFLDCPTREQRAWVGDSVVHQMVHLATNTDWRLAWHYLTLGNSPRSDGILPMSVAGDVEASLGMTIPDWSLHWIHGVHNLYRFLGDKALVKVFMPTIERILRWYVPYQTATGVLKDVPEWNLVDWAALFVEDTSSILTAIWARGLKEFAELAGWLDENSSRAWAEDLYSRARDGYEIFWDEARGTYVDHVKDGLQQKPISQVAGAMAIVSELAPQERWEPIARTITDPARLVVRSWTGNESGDYGPERIQKQMRGIYEADWDAEREVVIGEPFISYLVHDAVAQAGMADNLTTLYRRWTQFLTDGYDTIGECWGWGTHVHGWSCTPTRDLVFYTLGVTPAAPGYTTARIAPRLGGLDWAKGSVPTPHGLINVHATSGKIVIDSPVPVIVEPEGKAPVTLPAGQHEV